MNKNHEEKPFEKGEILEYVGRGFIGFDKQNRDIEFLEYDGDHDAYVKYKTFKFLVFLHELKRKK